jgi:hypothetical protein
MSEEKNKFLEKIEDEAMSLLDEFKKHPIRSLLVGMFILWAVKKIKELLRSM